MITELRVERIDSDYFEVVYNIQTGFGPEECFEHRLPNEAIPLIAKLIPEKSEIIRKGKTYFLSETEQIKFDEIKKAIKVLYSEEGEFKVSFGPSNGIGMPVSVYSTLMDKAFDLTDNESKRR
jgi:hypothetical protein